MASLNTRQGPLGRRLASHLLRRTTFRFNKARIDQFANMTATDAVNDLFTIPALDMPNGPIAWDTGNFFISDDGTQGDTNLNGGDRDDAILFWFLHESMMDTSIRHRMAWFLHVCFATQPQGMDRFFHYRLLQMFAIGNLRKLSIKITLDNQMLKFLDNRNNRKGSPNENYAREFFELYTILKGAQIGEGDYTNYTENDIVEAAKLLTGFTTGQEIDGDTGLRKGRAIVNRHETGDKTFSSAFGGKTITGRNTQEGMYEELDEFVQMVFDEVETAKAFVRRLYRFFVRDIINAEVEQGIIIPLANDLFNGDYELESVVKKLLMSEHFYDEDDSNATDEIIGGKMRSPLDLLLQTANFFDLTSSIPDATKYDTEGEDHYRRFYREWVRNTSRNSGMDPLNPPSVFGYDAYAQAPDYSKLWFDGATIINRFKVGEQLVRGKIYGNRDISRTRSFKIDVVAFVEQNVTKPDSADDVVIELGDYLFPEAIGQDRIDYFKSFLVDSLQNVMWKDAWDDYQKTGDIVYVLAALEDLFKALLRAPEYQTF